MNTSSTLESLFAAQFNLLQQHAVFDQSSNLLLLYPSTSQKSFQSPIPYIVVENITESLSKSLITMSSDISLLIAPICSFLVRCASAFKNKSKQLSSLFLFIQVLLFNLSSSAEKNRSLLQSTLLESTASGLFDQQSLIFQMKKIDQLIPCMLLELVDCAELSALLVNCTTDLKADRKGGIKMPELSILCGTIDYLTRKYDLHSSRYPQTRQSIGSLILEESEIVVRQEVRQTINNLLFGGNIRKIIKIMSNQNLKPTFLNFSILRILEANPRSAKKPRQIFQDTKLRGEDVLDFLLQHILLQRSKKDDLVFSEAHAQRPQVKLIINLLLFKFSDYFLQFSHFFNSLKPQPQNAASTVFYQQNYSSLSKIQTLIRSWHGSKLGNLLNSIYRVLAKRYSQQECIELLKLLFLNRFLLNPEFKALLDKQNIVPSTYADTANRVKTLFFPTKLRSENSKTIHLSQDIYNSFRQLVSKNSADAQKKRSIFISDFVLFQDFELIHSVYSATIFSVEDEISSQMAKQERPIETPTNNQQPSISFKSPGFSTVQKKHEDIQDPSSVKFIINEMHTYQSLLTDRKQTDKQNNSLQQPLIMAEELPTPAVQNVDMLEQLLNQRMERSERFSQRKAYRNSLQTVRNKERQYFESVSALFNERKQQILESRTRYELHLSSTIQ